MGSGYSDKSSSDRKYSPSKKKNFFPEEYTENNNNNNNNNKTLYVCAVEILKDWTSTVTLQFPSVPSIKSTGKAGITNSTLNVS